MEIVVGVGVALGLFAAAAIAALFEKEEEPSSTEMISQIRCDAERSMRQASDEYLKNIKEITRR
ncbi:MAG: hypothetical protein BGO39_15680 [Chloroflexi bacterium 54-19]|nr:MAG: hypothetical protein BGO39_15680 [Chloroflexi bacterium 54-19]